jgi:prophage endopeptidase
MIRLLDPRLWLAVIIGSLLIFAAGSYNGIQRTLKVAALDAAKADAAAAIRLAKVTEDAREKERLLSRSMAAIEANHQKELTDAKTERDRFIAGVRSGAIRLSIPVVADRRATASADPAPAAGDRHETRAELAPEAGAALAAIADDGDDGIRQLNACIDAYNVVREKINVQAR